MSSFKFQVSSSKTHHGFTMIELIVIIGVIGLLSAVMFSGERQNSEQRKMALEVQRVMQELRRAQNTALSASQSAACGDKVVAYGVYFQTASAGEYTLMADCDGNKNYSAGEAIKTIKLDAIVISTLQPSQAGGLAVVFIPPNPEISINGDVTTTNRSATIQFCLPGNSLCKSVVVNSKGVISAQ